MMCLTPFLSSTITTNKPSEVILLYISTTSDSGSMKNILEPSSSTISVKLITEYSTPKSSLVNPVVAISTIPDRMP